MNAPDLIADMDRLWYQAPVTQDRCWRESQDAVPDSVSQLIALFDRSTCEWLRAQPEPPRPRHFAGRAASFASRLSGGASAICWLQAERLVYEASLARIRHLLAEERLADAPPSDPHAAPAPSSRVDRPSSLGARLVAACAGSFVCRFWLEACAWKDPDTEVRELAAERLRAICREMETAIRSVSFHSPGDGAAELATWLEAKLADIRRRMAWSHLPEERCSLDLARRAA